MKTAKIISLFSLFPLFLESKSCINECENQQTENIVISQKLDILRDSPEGKGNLSKNVSEIEKQSNRKNEFIQHQVKQIQSIQQAIPFLNNLDDRAIVLFDIDGVISIPAEPCLHPDIFDKYDSIIQSLTGHFTREQRHVFNHLVVACTSKLIENEFVDVLIDLQNKNIKTFGFTASSPGIIHPQLPPFHLVREKYLKELKINFSIKNSTSIDFIDLNPTKGEYPGVRNGIIYSCGLNNTKGAVLKRFLSDYPNITKIVFLDDKLKNLDSVMTTLKTDFPTIEFLGFHYQGMEKLQCEDPGEDKVREYVQSLVELISANK